MLPAFAITYAIAGRGSWRRRIVGLVVSLVSVVAASAWWIVPMTLLPTSARAFVGGSTDGTALNLVLAYDGHESPFISKRLDCGIAMLHFELGALHAGAQGAWEPVAPPAGATDIARWCPPATAAV